MAKRRGRQTRGRQTRAQATAPVTQAGYDPDIVSAASDPAADIGYIDKQALSFKNILALKLEINKASKEEQSLQESLNKLGAKAAKEAAIYESNLQNIKRATERIAQARLAGDTHALAANKALLEGYENYDKLIKRTVGGSIKAQQEEAKKRKESLTAEKDLIKSINKERGFGARILDIFRTKEQKQLRIDIARAKAGGGANVPPKGKGGGGAGGGSGDQSVENILMSSGNPYAIAAAGVLKGVKAMAAPLKELGNIAKDALVAPFADAAGLLTGEDYGMGQGKLKTNGPSSILGGVQQVAGAIPVIGGFLSAAVGFVKTIVEGILGIEQGMARFARAMNISFGQASRMKADFEAIAASSGHIAINFARMAQSQVELTKELGVNKELNGDILKNDVLLRDVLGTELSIRQAIANTSYTANKNAVKLTQSIISTIAGFNRVVRVGFSFNGIMTEASKLSGTIGLAFSKYPEKMLKTLMVTKALGFELQQMASIQDGFLNFEESISKEIEAQVITGKEMNLAKIQEAALNNDYATMAKEISKYAGDAAGFVKMQRIDQLVIAEAAHMTVDQMADMLRKQELYTRLQVTDQKGLYKKLELLERQGKTQKEISDLVGADEYKAWTQVTTAERISEVIEKVKRTFVEFMKNSGLFDFLTKPEKIENFIKGLSERLASVIDIVGSVIASILRGIAAVAGFFDSATGQNLRDVAASVEYGTSTFAGGLRASTAFIGGQQAAPVSTTVQNGARQEAGSRSTSRRGSSGVEGSTAYERPIEITLTNTIDGETMTRKNISIMPNQFNAVMT